ncbi:prepilin-type N-terminal cleavage/methylation domain-containing protein [Phyllobacterium myrsinacearum]|uniref:General secretion pathway protein J n=1 Tax=Phyllobacterium myrsinacearum TaxID=28101 RepID=A0A839ESY1_9HYPH|nr:prepilin-type N-terminal cleavage/methylation domain-containing protein [Phyllobacterium myrsinacearum]MBA8882029.1 general secretion pathway protein J [Phyllobacterium myrsinacearum]
MSSSHSNGDAGEAGFTLVEMLVTLALIALLATVMIGAIVQMRSMSAISQRNDANTEFEALGNYLDKLIANAKPLPLIENNQEHLLVFEGAPDHIRFVAVIRIGSDQLGLRDVELAMRKNGNTFDLVQSSSPRRLSSSSNGPATLVLSPTLVTGLQSVTFEYLGVPSAPDATQSNWQTSWNEPGRLPRAVRLTVKAERNRQPVNLERLINLELAE